MFKRRTLIITLLLTLICIAPARSQTNDTFTSLTGGFTINLSSDTDGVNGMGSGIRFLWRQPEAEYEIGFHEQQGLPDGFTNGAFSADEVVRRYFNKFSTGKLIYKKEISLEGKPGFEFKYETDKANYLLRIFHVGDEVYSLQAEIPRKDKTQDEKVLRVFDSFRLLPEEFIKSETAKRIAAATPRSLPQSPAVAKAKSDLQDRNLKGKVRSVLTETANYAVRDSLLQKKPTLFEEFDEQGNLLKAFEYDSYGDVQKIKVYGYVAGKRVSKIGSIPDDYSPGGIALNFPMSGKPDSRFDESYVYKYLGGNLVEESTYITNVMVVSRAKYVYLKNKKETFYYGSDARPFRRIVDELDANGNPVKMTIFEPEGGRYKALDPYEIKYDSIDAQGNWTQRTISKFYGFGGQGKYFSEAVEYRTIIYY